MVKNVRNVESENETLVNINTGKIIDTQKRTTFLGTNPITSDRVIVN